MNAHPARLIQMANQIATAFRRQPPAEAVAATLDHIVKFWDPRMRRQLAEHAAGGGEGLNPAALAAARRLEIQGGSEGRDP